MSGTLKNYYEILGVSRSANADQIRTAYRKLLLKFHPDKNIGDDYFEDWSKKIIEAFEVLTNSELRSEYDKVYDETKAAWRLATDKEKNEKHNAPQDNEVVEPLVDAEIQKLVPVYVAAKQSYLIATQNLKNVEAKLNVRQPNRNIPIISCFAAILVTLFWIGMSNKEYNNEVDEVAQGSKNSFEKKSQTLLSNQLQKEEKPQPVDFETIDIWLMVTVPKAYFLKTPAGDTMPANFLSQGNKFHAIKKYQSYYYGIFKSSINASYNFEGWIDSSYTKPIR